MQDPLCNYLVEFLPRWLAPNLVTLIGFLFNLIPNLVIIALYDNDMEGPIDGWVAYMLGVSY